MADWCIKIADSLLEKFDDKVKGGFYFTSHDHEQLIQRSKVFSDDAMPSGNGIAALTLQRLGLLLGDNRYIDAAENCIKATSQELQQHAMLNCSVLNALDEHLNPITIIIIRGNSDEIVSWQNITNTIYLPRTLVFAIPETIHPISPISEKQPMHSVCAYICEGTNCLPPLTDIQQFSSYIRQYSQDNHIND